MTLGQIALRALILGFIISFAVITGFAYTTLLERKLLARLQHRVGPNRAGYLPIPRRGKQELKLLGGILQPAADAVKLFFKEDPTPGKADKTIYFLAPMLAVMPAIIILAVIPWAGKIPGLYRTNIITWQLPRASMSPCSSSWPSRRSAFMASYSPAGRPTANTLFWAASAPQHK